MTHDERLKLNTRRHFFGQCGVGIGRMALASLMADGALFGARAGSATNPLAPKPPHFKPRIDHVIYMFMAGGPSHLDLFDYKPKLQELDGQVTPDSIMKGKRFAFMDEIQKEKPLLFGSRRKFTRHGEGIYVSELLPHIASIANEITMLHGVSTENFNHGPAKSFANSGSFRFGRPSIGAWVTYGIGSQSEDLPGFVVLQSGPRGPRGGAALWASGFLPTVYQGVPFRSSGDPILDLSRPKGVSARTQKQTLEAIKDLNLAKLAETGDPEINTRIASYEMAYRMQTSGPELIDFSKESAATLELYGAEAGKASFANNCLLAARLVERGVRFVQLYHTDWDHHADISKPLDDVTKEVDRPAMALVKDLKRRGLLDRTLVIWGGEFGRTPMRDAKREEGKIGRNHHIDSFSIWMAGGGLPGGQVVGGSDDLGFSPLDKPIETYDVHATILHMLGLEHTKLTFKFQGRDFRLTDVKGTPIKKMVG
ncbi:MAG: DUF1501 domain-containing protein [Bryobacteraceae bacterium]